MLKYKQVKENKNFIGREYEKNKLSAIDASKESAIVIIHGRRRVGKTELIEQTYKDRNILKFEGLENRSEEAQRNQVLLQLAKYTNDPLIAKLTLNSWIEIFELLAKHIKNNKCTLYFEELQWLADYKDNFITELKYSWDNLLRHNNKLIIVLCGSSPSFMIKNVVHSKALYNRSQYEIPLKPFDLKEAHSFIGEKPLRDIMDSYLTLGGIPEYLKKIKKYSSLYLGICSESFPNGAFFLSEYDRIFTSSLAQNIHYKKIIDFLSHKKFATRDNIANHLKIKKGGTLSDVLYDLEICGFIICYVPYQLKENSKLVRYAINDQYLQFYFKFIKPHIKDIKLGRFNNNPSTPIRYEAYLQWLGFSFERFLRLNHFHIAKLLGFSAIEYHSGAFFNRETESEKPGFQIDLIFKRADRVITICEIKYLNRPVNKSIIKQFEEKLSLFDCPKNHSIHKVLISAEGAEKTVSESGYFDDIITLEDIFKH